MAQTDFAALTNAQKKVWSTRTWQQGRDMSFWFSNGFVGAGTSDTSRPVHLVTELTETERGDQCIMQLVADLDGDGVTGDSELEGNEESLVNDDETIRLDQLRHAVKNKGRMSEQRTVLRFRTTARNKLSYWLSERIDQMMFLVASGVSFTYENDGSTRSASSKLTNLAFNGDITAPSTNRIKYGGTATATNNITTSDTMTWDGIVKARAYAKRKRIKPIRMKGREYYCMVMSTEQARDLKQDSDYQTINKDANVRGKGNPLFDGALSIVDGVILYEHNFVYSTLGAASGSKYGSSGTVDGAQALLLGAQAVGFARIGDAMWEESDNTDYGNKQGIGYGRIVGMKKPVFQSRYDSDASEDFGVLSYYTAAAA